MTANEKVIATMPSALRPMSLPRPLSALLTALLAAVLLVGWAPSAEGARRRRAMASARLKAKRAKRVRAVKRGVRPRRARIASGRGRAVARARRNRQGRRVAVRQKPRVKVARASRAPATSVMTFAAADGSAASATVQTQTTSVPDLAAGGPPTVSRRGSSIIVGGSLTRAELRRVLSRLDSATARRITFTGEIESDGEQANAADETKVDRVVTEIEALR